MHRIFSFVLVITFICLLTSCSANNLVANEANKEDNIVELLTTNDHNSRIIFNRYYQKMVSYNIESNSVKKQSNFQNYFQYGFNVDSKYFTSGNSITNNFEILFVDGVNIKSIVKLKDKKNQSIFPLSTDNNHILFIQLYYDKNGNEINRKLVSLTNNSELIEYKKVKDLVTWGTILSNNLYYTVFDDKSNNYSLYRLDLSNYNNNPVFIEKNINQPELYVHNNKIYKSDKNRIYNGNDYYDKSSLNFFYDEYNILIQINPNKEHIVLSVVNTANKHLEKSLNDVIDYSIQNGVLKVYCAGRTENIELNRVK
jgi:hypothetical protein